MPSDISNLVLPWGNDDNTSMPCSEHSCATYFDITDEKHTSQIVSDLRRKNIGRLIISHLNVNSLRNKFDELKFLTRGRIDILMISETKLDESFPTNQLLIEGFSAPFRFDRNNEGGGIIIYIRSDIPCKVLNNHDLPKNIEGIFIELYLRKNKWLLFGGYNPNKEFISNFLDFIGNSLDTYIRSYDNLLIMGDLTTEMEVDVDCDVFNLQNLIKEPTCFKSVLNPSSDVILTNRRNFFHNSLAFETGLSDYHKMTITVLKRYVKKLKPKTIKYRSYKLFDDISFKSELISSLECRGNHNMKYDEFKTLFMEVLTKHAPMKEKVIRGNNAPFMNKMLSKAFMERSRLKNKYNNFPNEVNKISYKKQRNFCTNLLKKVKNIFYNNLDINIFNDNKKFWKCIRPFSQISKQIFKKK